MKKLESFLYDYSWLLKLGIIAVLFFWAAEGHFAARWIYEESRKDKFTDEREDPRSRMEAEAELRKFGSKLIKEAEHNKNYSPLECFEDMKKLKFKNKELYDRELPGMHHTLLILNSLSLSDPKSFSRKEAAAEIETAQKNYREWLRTADVHRNDVDETFIREDETDPEKTKAEMLAALLGILEWALAFYWKSLMFIALYYLVRMAQRKGILETLLADKKKFALAVVLWPIFLGKYPYNVTREIIVEAELRRLGNIFRKLSPKEKLKIRAIANSNGYANWRKNFRTENRFAFRRPLLIALAATILVHAFVPVANSAETPAARGDPLVIEKIGSGNMGDDDDEDNSAIDACVPEPLPALALYASEKLEIISERAKRITRGKKTEHIPISWLFSGSILIPS